MGTNEKDTKQQQSPPREWLTKIFRKESSTSKNEVKLLPPSDEPRRSRIVQFFNSITFAKFTLWFKTFTVDRDSTFYGSWLWIVSAAFLYNVIFVPIRASFVDFNYDHFFVWLILDYVIADAIYLADMLLKARTRYFQGGIQIYEVKQLMRHYIFSTEFLLDAAAIFPLDIVYIGYGFAYTVVRMNRLFRYGRFFEMTERVDRRSNYPNLFRFIITVLGVLLTILYASVFYHSYSKAVGFGQLPDDFQLSQEDADKPFFPRFIRCLFWGMMMITFVGEQQEGKTALQQFIAVALWITGQLMFGVIVGRVGEILDEMSSVEDAFKRQLDAVRGYLAIQKVPLDVSRKVVFWFQYAFDNNLLRRSEKILKPLPDNLKTELAVDNHFASVRKVPLFADLEISLIKEMVSRLQLQIFAPQDYVCRKGDIGREMYVVRRGNLEVVSDDGSKVFVTLGAGSVFGEISLLSIPGSRTGNKRTANVRSKGYSDLYSLSKDDLYDILEDYPGAMQKMVDKGTEILRKEKKLDEDAITKKMAEEASTAEKFARLKAAIEETERQIAYLTTSMAYSRKYASVRLSCIEEEVAERQVLLAQPSPPSPQSLVFQAEEQQEESLKQSDLMKKRVTFSESTKPE